MHGEETNCLQRPNMRSPIGDLNVGCPPRLELNRFARGRYISPEIASEQGRNPQGESNRRRLEEQNNKMSESSPTAAPRETGAKTTRGSLPSGASVNAWIRFRIKTSKQMVLNTANKYRTSYFPVTVPEIKTG